MAATARPALCDRRTHQREFVDEGDVFIVTAHGLVSPALSGCEGRPLGWSSGGERLVLYQQVLGPCPAAVPICPTGNVVALDLRSHSVTALISATYLREKKLDDPKIVSWGEQAGVLYAWSMTSPIGGLGALLAVRAPSGEILWSMESYGVTLLTQGRIASLDRKVTDLERTGLNWEWQYGIVRDGTTVAKYAALPTSGGCRLSPDGQYIWWQPTNSESEIHFATKADADIWAYRLPHSAEAASQVWAPASVLVVQSYGRVRRKGLLLDLWLLDPAKKEATKLFEGTSPLPPSVDTNSVAYRELSVARWAR